MFVKGIFIGRIAVSKLIIKSEVEGMVYGYVRANEQTADENSLEVQRKLLLKTGATMILQEESMEDKRPQLDRLLGKLKSGDKLIITKLDRIARTTRQGIEMVESLIEKGVIIHILNIGIIDDTPNGQLIRNVFKAFSEMEHDMLVERTKKGKALAKQRDDFKEGRPKKFDENQMKEAMALLQKHSYTEVAKMSGISKSTLIRYKKSKEN